MKKIQGVYLFGAAALLSSCTYQQGMYTTNNQTIVELKENNFRVVQSISGEATSNYFVFIPLDPQNLAGRAKADLMSKADLVGKPRALVNVTTDVKYSTFMGLFNSKTFYISADVIEFGNDNTWTKVKEEPINTSTPPAKLKDSDLRLKTGDKVSFYTQGNEKMEGIVKEVEGATITISYLDSKRRLTTIVLPLKEVRLAE